MLPVGYALAKFDKYVVSWVAVPWVTPHESFHLSVTVLVWASTDSPTRYQIRRALRRYFGHEQLTLAAHDTGNFKEHEYPKTSLRIRVKTYRNDK